MPRSWSVLALVPAIEVLSACASDAPGERSRRVESVSVSAQGSTTLRPGGTVQLTATLRDATGAPLTGRQVAWTTTDSLVAAVDPSGRVVAITPGIATIAATSEGKSSSMSITVEAVPVATIQVVALGDTVLFPGGVTQLFAVLRDSAGGILGGRTVTWSSSDSSKALVDQAGRVTAVAQGSSTIVALSGNAAGVLAVRVVGLPVATVTVTAPGDTIVYASRFLQLTATLQDSTGAGLTGRVVTWASSDTTIARVNAAGRVAGQEVGGVTITATSESRTGTLRLGVKLIPVAQVTIPAPEIGALYPTGTSQLTASLRDSASDSIIGRVVQWSSSDSLVATVGQSGLVTGVAAGAATITATSEGKSGSTDFAILPAPMADWSRAGEWVTFQGDSGHTGFVVATLDPRTFGTQWTRTIVTGTALNPVTAGSGGVYVSTSAYFGAQQLVALDATTGTPRWSYNFGGIHGVHPPATAAGRVYVTTSGHADSYLYSFDAATGTRVFRRTYGNQWSRYYAPVVAGGAVYMAGGYYDGMYRFDATSGDSVWFAATNQYNEWTPSVRDGVVYAYTGSYNPKVVAVSATTGAEIYAIPDSGFSWNGWSMYTAPVLGSQSNLLATQAGRVVSFDLNGRRVAWERRAGYTGAVTVAGGVAYVINGNEVEALSESNGSVLWFWRSPAGPPTRTMIVTENLLFVSADSKVYAIDLASRRAVWVHQGGGHLALSNQGTLFIARSNGTLEAITVR